MYVFPILKPFSGDIQFLCTAINPLLRLKLYGTEGDVPRMGMNRLTIRHLFFPLAILWLLSEGFSVSAQTAENGDDNYLDAVVVSASRTPMKQDSIPVPVTVIGKREIRAMGSRRLLEVLREQTGFNFITDEHGTGVQLQGMAPDYTMIMIDGQPMVGRLTGKFDLNRITVANIEQIEIIKGASSSLYGSEAMGGVINIITRSATADTSVSLAAKYGGYGVADVSGVGNYSFLKEKATVQLAGDYYKTDGFAVAPDESGFKNLPPYHSYTIHGKARYQFTGESSLLFSARYGVRIQENNYDFTGNKPQEDRLAERDANITGTWNHLFSEKWKSSLTYYLNRYNTDETVTLTETGVQTDSAFFRQRMQRLEWQHNYAFSSRMLFTGGAGGNIESVNATRYPGERHMNSVFIYGQQQFFVTPKWNVIAGVRGDWNWIYGGQLNPKLAWQYDWNEYLQLRASVGRGFKAPDFRQLYLSFTNPLVGYTVIGTEEIGRELAKMEADGSLVHTFPVAARSGRALKAESSWSYNGGFTLKPNSALRLNVNAFYNNLSNLILSVPVAEKVNAQQVFSYVNVSRAYTTGLEVDAYWLLTPKLRLQAGYQLLYAKDRDVLDSIRSGAYQLRNPATGESQSARPSDYYGLTMRARNQANLKLLYCHTPWGLTVSLRANFLDRSPFAAVSGNGSGFTNRYDIFTPAYFIFSGAVEKSFRNDRFAVQVSGENLAGYTHALVPGQPGRQAFAGLRWNWHAGRDKQVK